MIKVFSGRKEEVEGTLLLADAFVLDDDNRSYFNELLQKERSEEQTRIDERWAIIEQKQSECKAIRREIQDLADNLASTRKSLNETNEYLWDEDTCSQYVNPTWRRLDRKSENISDSISKARREHQRVKKAPAYLKQPLPKDVGQAKRALFFCYMPEVLRLIWESSYFAQKSIFSAGTRDADLSYYVDYHSFYNGPYEFRKSKQSTRTPLNLYCPSPPRRFGSEDVEFIGSREDGIWYPEDFNPLIIWKHGDPFNVERTKAVDRFTENISNEKLQWAVKQSGRDTPSDRGNWSLSKLYLKPDNLSREQYLNFGDLRAFPLLQINNVLCAIKNMSLPFKLSETHQLINLVFYHIGEVSYDNGVKKLWKAGLYDTQFINGLRMALEECVDTLKDTPKNQEEFLVILEIISFLSRFAPDFFVPLSDKCSDIAIAWANDIEDKLKESLNNSSAKNLEITRARHHIFILYALLAYEMIPSLNVQQVRKLLCLIVRMNATLPEKGKIPQTFISLGNKLMGRLNFMLARLFHGRTFESSHLTDAARYIFPGRVENEMVWKELDGFYCFYTQNREGYYISINVLNGIILLNGSPPGRLSLEVLNRPLYQKIFGENNNFSTELLDDGTQKT
jgi:hypothetical protein